ncbi:MAG: hypothetical protein AB1422_01590 [bacterium]
MNEVKKKRLGTMIWIFILLIIVYPVYYYGPIGYFIASLYINGWLNNLEIRESYEPFPPVREDNIIASGSDLLKKLGIHINATPVCNKIRSLTNPYEYYIVWENDKTRVGLTISRYKKMIVGFSYSQKQKSLLYNKNPISQNEALQKAEEYLSLIGSPKDAVLKEIKKIRTDSLHSSPFYAWKIRWVKNREGYEFRDQVHGSVDIIIKVDIYTGELLFYSKSPWWLISSNCPLNVKVTKKQAIAKTKRFFEWVLKHKVLKVKSAKLYIVSPNYTYLMIPPYDKFNTETRLTWVVEVKTKDMDKEIHSELRYREGIARIDASNKKFLDLYF